MCTYLRENGQKMVTTWCKEFATLFCMDIFEKNPTVKNIIF